MESVFSPSVLRVPPVACLRLGGAPDWKRGQPGPRFRGALCSQEPADDGMALGGPGSASCLNAGLCVHVRGGKGPLGLETQTLGPRERVREAGWSLREGSAHQPAQLGTVLEGFGLSFALGQDAL